MKALYDSICTTIVNRLKKENAEEFSDPTAGRDSAQHTITLLNSIVRDTLDSLPPSISHADATEAVSETLARYSDLIMSAASAVDDTTASESPDHSDADRGASTNYRFIRQWDGSDEWFLNYEVGMNKLAAHIRKGPYVYRPPYNGESEDLGIVLNYLLKRRVIFQAEKAHSFLSSNCDTSNDWAFDDAVKGDFILSLCENMHSTYRSPRARHVWTVMNQRAALKERIDTLLHYLRTMALIMDIGFDEGCDEE